MTRKNKALSQLARLALNAVSDKSTEEQQETSVIIAAALSDDLPHSAALAHHHALFLEEQISHREELESSLSHDT